MSRDARPGPGIAFAHLVPAVVLILAACRGGPPEPERDPVRLPPDLESQVECYAGSALSGPQPIEAGAASFAGEPLLVRARIVALASLPPYGELLSRCSSLVVAPHTPDPLQTVSRHARNARCLQGAEASGFSATLDEGGFGPTREAARHEGALVPGATCTLRIAAIEQEEDPENFLGEFAELGPVHKSLSVSVSVTGEGRVVLGIGIEGLATPPPGPLQQALEPSKERLRPGAPRALFERVLIQEGPSAGGAPFVVLVPTPFASGAAEAFAIVVEVTHAPSEEAAAAAFQLSLLELLADLRAGSQKLGEGQSRLPEGAAETLALEQALAALHPAAGDDLRGPLVYLAAAGNAPFAADLALVAEAETLGGWVETIRARQDTPAQVEPREAELGWLIERSAYLQVAQEALAAELPSPLEGILLRHTGEVGRFPSLLEDAALASSDAAAFEARLAAENLLFLEDSHPSARVRAFDWLRAHQAAPEGYRPLAPRDERRAALARHAAQATDLQAAPASSAPEGPR